MKHILSSLVFIALFMQTNIVLSQRVGLVLSGGGAKGLYHVGIIKALEENDIPIDYIAGTSMGSIVAALYAAGYSPERMETIFMGDEVLKWVSGKIDDKYFDYYKKMQPSPSMISLDLNINKYVKKLKDSREKKRNPDSVLYLQNGDIRHERSDNVASFSLNKPGENTGGPAALVSSSQIDMAMMYYMAGASALCKNNFDSLMVPFRCVSVDINTRLEYVWKEGDLGMAVRSSMAIPLVFRPIKVDSMMMYDGGLMNNFPWENLDEDFSPDVIIGGKCVSGNPNINTIPGQIEMLVMAKTNYKLPKDRGIMIERNIDVGMLDFKRAAYIMQQGYNDAMAAMPIIKERIKRRVSVEEMQTKRLKFNEKVPALVFDEIDVKGVSPQQASRIKSELKFKQDEANEIDFEEFRNGYFKMLSGGSLDGGFPVSKYNDSTGYFSLAMRMRNKPSLKVMVGLNISSTAVNQGYLGLQYRTNSRGIGSIYYLDGYIGAYYMSGALGGRFDFYRDRPLYMSAHLVYNHFDYARGNSQSLSYRYTDIGYSRLNEYYVDWLIGVPVTNKSKFEVRLATGINRYGYFRDSYRTNNDTPDNSNLGLATANVALSQDSRNYSMYPTTGTKQSLSLYGAFTREVYNPGTASLTQGVDVMGEKSLSWWGGVAFVRDQYLKICKYFNLGYEINAMYGVKPKLSNDYITKMVEYGFSPTPHSLTLYMPEFHNSSHVALGLKPIFLLNEKIYLKTEAYCYKPNLNDFRDLKSNLKYIFSAAAVYQSPIGPVSLSYSYYDITGLKKNYFTFNFGYLLFNKQAIQY